MNSAHKNFLVSAFCAVFIIPLLFSCQEDEELSGSSASSNEQLITDEAIADDLFEDMDEISMEAATYSTNGRSTTRGGIAAIDCVNRSVENGEDFSKSVTLTFSGDCEGPKGRIRTGTLLIDHSIDFNASTYTVSTSFKDFFVNEHQLEGTRTLVYSAENNKLITVKVTLTNGKVTLSDGSIITRSGNFTRIVDREKGEITVSGTASGTNRFGVEYVSEITTPLVYPTNCASDGIYMPAQGIKSISRTGKASLEIDFGDGKCDKNVTLTSKGENRTVEIKLTRK